MKGFGDNVPEQDHKGGSPYRPLIPKGQFHPFARAEGPMKTDVQAASNLIIRILVILSYEGNTLWGFHPQTPTRDFIP